MIEMMNQLCFIKRQHAFIAADEDVAFQSPAVLLQFVASAK